jgi:hypothetical protein
LVELQEARKVALSERAAIIDANKKQDTIRVQSEKNANTAIIQSRLDAQATLSALGIATTESLLAQEDIKIAQIDALNQQKLISEAEYQEALFQIKAATDERIRQLDQQRVESAINASGSISAAFLNASKNTGATAVAIGKTLNNLAVRGFGNAFQKIGAAIATGKNINQAFVDSVKNTASEAASAFGDYYIKLGVAELAATSGAKGSATVAGGAGLKLLAGVLGASGGGGGGASVSDSGFGGSVTDSLDNNGALDQQDIERQDPNTNVEIVVQGSLVQQEELGTFITETLNESFGKQGVSLTDARFA